jgi:three-Cys-motif partner protein
LDNVLEFFQKKRPWSRYKDLILDYYLKPYLTKVTILRKPIVVVDCFAGPGKFEDGADGSPLIISKHLLPLHEQQISVSGFFIETDKVLYDRLVKNTSNTQVPTETRHGNFRDYVEEIASLAKNHTVFVYLDPIYPSDLLFNDLKSVYDHLLKGQSIETLINFMSTGFLRAVWGLKSYEKTDSSKVDFWDQVAGGTYWQSIAFDASISQRDRTDKLAAGYADQLKRWFEWVLAYPIREKYENEFPKYHLIFGSRSPDAIDIMNRAMVKARREFVGSRFIKGMLFENQPTEEIVDASEIKKIVVDTSKRIGKTHWSRLRAYATVSYPCMYTDSEFNAAIKKAIQENDICSNCSGKKIVEDALIWPK